MNPPVHRVFLMDNGSLEPASVRQLRGIAATLTERMAWPEEIVPVSLAHSAKIPAEKLDGRPAELFEAALDRGLSEGVRAFTIVPLFVGPSLVLLRHLPALIAARQMAFPTLTATVTPPLFAPGETRLGEILAEHVREQLGSGRIRPRVAVVDHGSPSAAVVEVRDRVTQQMRIRLGDVVADVAACSMERRPGEAFAFNEPLLGNLLLRPEWRQGPLIVAMIFIAPGRHAGAEGDVERIVRGARGGEMADVLFTRLLGQNSLLVDILADRLRSAMGYYSSSQTAL